MTSRSTAKAASTPAASTSRWVTARSNLGPRAPIDRGGGGLRAVRSPAKPTAPARAIAVSGLGSSGLSVLERSQEFDGVFFLTKVSPNFVAIGISYAQFIAHEPHGRRRLVMVGDELDGLYYGTESMPRP